MKNNFRLKLLLPWLVLVYCSVNAQEYTLTTTAANTVASKSVIDLPSLSGNVQAIIIATPLGNTKTLNPHPIGAWYYSGKWNVFNSDHAPMLQGLTYKIQYFLSPGPQQFVHLVTQQNLGADGSYIDNPVLNNKPNVLFAIFQNHAPDIRPGSWLNQHEAKQGYNASTGKWYIANTNGQVLQKGAAYNIAVIAVGSIVPPGNPVPGNPVPIDNSPTTTCKCPASLPPDGQATGDLVGMYPNPMVAKILGRSLSNTVPLIGQVLKWNGTEWSPSAVDPGSAYTGGLGITLTGNAFSASAELPMWNANKILGLDVMTTPPVAGQVLKFGGASWYPADDNTGPASTSQTPKSYYKQLAGDFLWPTSTNFNEDMVQLPGMTIQITITTPSLVNISVFSTTIVTTNCGLINNCAGQSTGFHLYRDNTLLIKSLKKGSNESITLVLPNYPELLNPGTYTYKFFGRRMYLDSQIRYMGASNTAENYKTYMTVQVFPQ